MLTAGRCTQNDDVKTHYLRLVHERERTMLSLSHRLVNSNNYRMALSRVRQGPTVAFTSLNKIKFIVV